MDLSLLQKCRVDRSSWCCQVLMGVETSGIPQLFLSHYQHQCQCRGKGGVLLSWKYFRVLETLERLLMLGKCLCLTPQDLKWAVGFWGSSRGRRTCRALGAVPGALHASFHTNLRWTLFIPLPSEETKVQRGEWMCLSSHIAGKC